jgi:clan AA aspartic protease
MITGVVSGNRQAIVRLRIRGPLAEFEIDAIIDTGFTSNLTLPNATVAALGLQQHSRGSATLADGTTHSFQSYPLDILWDGTWRRVLVYALGKVPLLGMRLLAAHTLKMECNTGGAVEIKSLP